jgi:hypothetical protein
MSQKQNQFNYDELITCAKGEMFGHGNPQLPMPPMLMMDRITKINDHGGKKGWMDYGNWLGFFLAGWAAKVAAEPYLWVKSSSPDRYSHMPNYSHSN